MFKKINLVVFGFILSAFVIEVLLQFMPVSTGLDLQAVNAENKILRGTPGFKSIYSKGWNFRMSTKVTLNNYGYPISYDYLKGSSSVLAIGDSYVQASAIPAPNKFYALVDEHLKKQNMRAYGLGMSGGSLADYLAMSRWGAEEFDVKTIFIVLIVGDLNDSILANAAGHHYFARSAVGYQLQLIDNPRKYKAIADIVLSSSLLRYLLDNLAFGSNLMKIFGSAVISNHSDCPVDPLLDAHPNLTMHILHEFTQLAQEKGLKVKFILDPVNRKNNQDTPSCERDIDRFATQAERAGFEVVHLESAFKAENASQGLRMDFSPVDDHWNSRAHAIVADKIMSAL